MGEKAIWVDIALLCCIFTHLRLVKIRLHTHAISSMAVFLASSPWSYVVAKLAAKLYENLTYGPHAAHGYHIKL